MTDLYDVFSPVALRGRSAAISGTGPLNAVIAETYARVGATLSDDAEITVRVEGGAVEVRCAGRINWIEAAEGTPPEAAAWAALFLACQGSRSMNGCVLGVPLSLTLSRQGREHTPSPLMGEGQGEGERSSPFALYDTFSPTALRGKVALVDGPGGDLTATIALELARAGARVAVCAPADEAVGAALQEAQVLGRRMIATAEPRFRPAGEGPPEAGATLVAETLKAFGRLDLLVNAGDRGAHLTHAAGPHLTGGAIVNVVPHSDGKRFKPEELSHALLVEARRHGARVNALGLGETGVSPQEVAWVIIFLASDAAAYVTGQWVPLNGASPSP